MKVNKKALGIGVLAAGAIFAFALPAGAAVNLQSESSGGTSIAIVKTAKLKANGAATIVTVNISCPLHYNADVSAAVTQTIGAATTNGAGNLTSVVCTGTVQKVKVPVTVTNHGAPFKAGVAYATGHVNVYGNTYISLDTGREIVNVN